MGLAEFLSVSTHNKKYMCNSNEYIENYTLCVYDAWSKCFGTVALITELKYAGWSCLTQIGLKLSRETYNEKL